MKYFICPGAARAATTTLFNIMKQHPDIATPDKKELRFFTLEKEKGLKCYLKHFSDVDSNKLLMDISPVYLIDSEAPKKIYETLGKEVKFVFMLRHPVKRLISQYIMEKNLMHEDLDFEKAINRSRETKKEVSLKRFKHEYGYDYISESMYGKAIERFLEYYDISKMHFIIFEEFIEDMQESISKLCVFLGIDSNFSFNLNVQQNSGVKATKFLFIEKLISKFKVKPGFDNILGKNWEVLTWLKKLKRKILKYKKDNDSVTDKKAQNELMNLFEEDIKLLSNITGRKYDLWK